MSIKRDYWVCLIASISIMAVIILFGWATDLPVTEFLAGICIISLLGLPWYIMLRIRNSENENAARLEVESVLKEANDNLTILGKDLRKSIKQLNKINSYEEWLTEKRRKPKTHERYSNKPSVLENFKLIDNNIEAVNEDLQDLLMLMKNYGFFYENMLNRVAIRRLQLKGKPVLDVTIKEELKEMKGRYKQ